MNDLATIQRIRSIRPHNNAEKLELAEILGWQVVVKKNEFKEGDLCVYICIDTVLPELPIFEFLRNKSFRIKPIRLRGQNSAGIAFPIDILPTVNTTWELKEGEDVTDILGIKHYVKPISPSLAGIAIGSFPTYLIMTDEKNLRSYPEALPELWGRPYYITRKDDGSSGTYFINAGEFGVCSRTIHLKDSETNGFWRMARKYNIENALRTSFPDQNIAIQGEVVGSSIQKNKLGLTEMELHVFNLFDINSRTYLDYDKLVKFCSDNNLTMVTILDEGNAFGYSLEELIAFANKQLYPTGDPAEGIVIRPKEGFRSKELNKTWSGKIISELYKEEDPE